MRIKYFAATSALLLLFSSPTAIAAVKAGNSCSKVGLKSTVGSTTFKCSSISKKKIWVKVSKVTKIPLTPTTTNEVIPTQKSPSTPLQPTSLTDLVAHPESISYWAWKLTSEKVLSSKESGPKVIIANGPNTVIPTSKTIEAVIASARLYSGFSMPSQVQIIYFNFSDSKWAQNEFNKYALKFSGNEAMHMCPNADSCWGAEADIDLKGNAVILIGSKDPASSNENHINGTLEAHEFTHTIQLTQFMGSPKEEDSHCCIGRYIPRWAVEGTAEFSQAASLYPSSHELYMRERKNDIDEIVGNNAGKFTTEWIKNYLDLSSEKSWSEPANQWRMYDVGFMVFEALASLKGPDVVMQLHKDVASGLTWSQAFEKSFSVNWEQALPLLAEAIHGQFRKK